MILNYDDFVNQLLSAGFAIGGGNAEGIYNIITWDWNEQPPYDTPIRWHTGDIETDPWEWRMRVLNERDDIAYGKIFFKKSGYVTREWVPYFLAARRGQGTFDEEFQSGNISRSAKRIYSAVSENGTLPLEAIKAVAGFDKEEKSKFDRGLVELQMKMYLTMCGSRQKISRKGEEYGWSSTVFCTTESFWGEEVFAASAKIKADEAAERITERVLLLNPEANSKKILKFIKG